MGLDMYLTKKTYIGANYEHNAITGTIALERAGVPIPITFNNVTDIIEMVGYWRKVNSIYLTAIAYHFNDVSNIEMVGYWRKVNAIHKWFVDNVQEGQDDCKEYTVTREQLISLLDSVNKCIAAFDDGELEEPPEICLQLLPPQEGCFFGRTNVDRDYLEDLKYTKGLLETIVAAPFEWHTTFYYQSSW